MNETYKDYKSKFLSTERKRKQFKPLILIFINLIVISAMLYYASTRKITSQKKYFQGLLFTFKTMKLQDNAGIILNLSIQNKGLKTRELKIDNNKIIFIIKSKTGNIFYNETDVSQSPANQLIKKKDFSIYELSKNDLINLSTIYNGELPREKLEYIAIIKIAGKEKRFSF